MPIRNLERIFAPRSVAVIGASERPGSVGATVLKNLLGNNGSWKVYPVNPKHQELQQRPCWPSIREIEAAPDLAVICTRAELVPSIVRQCGEAGTRGIVILSAGFRETGSRGDELESAIRAEARPFEGLRILGPNCLGFMVPDKKLNVSFVDDPPLPGRVAFVSQSGALCTAVLDWARAENVGFSCVVSLGNMLDVGVADLIDYLSMDAATESIILYVESINEARQFMSAARAFARKKPIIVYKAGRFAESAQVAASHTGALAGVDSVYEAVFARAGIVRVFEIDDLFDCAELLAHHRLPRGPRLAIVTNAGGPGVIATDALLSRRGTLAQLSEATLQMLNERMPAPWSHRNPVDMLGDAGPDRYSIATQAVLRDENVDGLLVILSPQAMSCPTESAQSAIDAVKKYSAKPLLASWMGGEKVRAGIELFRRAGIPTYSSPEKAVGAFAYLVSYARRKEVLYETPREIPVNFPLDRGKLRAVFDTVLSEGREVLSENLSKALLEAYEIPVSKAFVGRTTDDAVELAHRVGFPVVLKVFSPEITHKTDVGGVELNLTSDADVRAAFQRIAQNLAKHRPEARFDGVTVQPMVNHPSARELIVGAKRDPVFGMVLLVGMGGTAAEVDQDYALELPPLSERLARRMLESLRSWPLLQGYRGRPGVNVERLIEILMRFSYLVADYPEVAELDVNPLLATPQEITALDARIVLDHNAILHPPRPYSHLAIRPYPEEYVRKTQAKDGSELDLRPIRPEDEPMWHALLQSCSAETIRQRFRYMFKGTTHEMATRFCVIDYDREIAIVAERTEDGVRKMLGVGRLVADADHTNAEFAVLVGDPWQGLGIGSLLIDYCLEICRHWGIHRVVAETATDNRRMVTMFERRGFALDHSTSPDTVLVAKDLEA